MGGCLDRSNASIVKIQSVDKEPRLKEERIADQQAIDTEFDLLSNSDVYSINDKNLAASICANERLLNTVRTT